MKIYVPHSYFIEALAFMVAREKTLSFLLTKEDAVSDCTIL